MNVKGNKKTRPGVALLVVLFIVMAITILSLGFMSRSDVELACGQNMILRTELDYLAESGLEHARGLILNPQDISPPDEYWKGGMNLQLTSGGDFYEVKVERDASDLCNYIIDCNSYRLEGTERIGLSRLQAVLRIDPCIAYWVGSNTTVRPSMTIDGDVYCGGDLINNGTINGDVFAVGTITGTSPEGQQKSITDAGVVWPDLAVNDYEPTYYIGSTPYSAQIVDANISSSSGEVFYSISDVNMLGNVTINGTLVVNGTLKISGTGNVITAEKNFPALLVTGQVVMVDGASLMIQGLAQIGQGVSIETGSVSANITVTGGLFIALNGITSNAILANITADPAIASIETWSTENTSTRWSPAAGAFFKSIERR